MQAGECETLLCIQCQHCIYLKVLSCFACRQTSALWWHGRHNSPSGELQVYFWRCLVRVTLLKNTGG